MPLERKKINTELAHELALTAQAALHGTGAAAISRLQAEAAGVPEPTDFQLECLFDAVHSHGEFGRGFREHARQILAARDSQAQAAPAAPVDALDGVRAAWEVLPDGLRCHPGLKAYMRAVEAALSRPQAEQEE